MLFNEIWQRSICVNKLILTADSTFDLTPAMAAALDIEVIASWVRMDSDELPDYPDVTMDDLFAFHDRTGKLPQTAAAAPAEYTDFFRRFTDRGDRVLHIAKSSGMSSCFDNACMAAAELPGVTVFDSRNISSGSAMIAVEAARLRDLGLDGQELLDKLEEYRGRVQGAFIVEDLTYLHKGGRCSSLAHFGANLLHLRPQIVIRDGVMSAAKKYRGRFDNCALELIDDMLALPHETGAAYVAHTVTDPQRLDGYVRYLREKGGFQRVVALPAGAAVSCHCGPNTFGVFIIKSV